MMKNLLRLVTFDSFVFFILTFGVRWPLNIIGEAVLRPGGAPAGGTCPMPLTLVSHAIALALESWTLVSETTLSWQSLVYSYFHYAGVAR